MTKKNSNDFHIIKNLVYDKCNFELSSPVMAEESSEYGACDFSLNNFFIKFRVAKITPTKIGQFVTFWKRNKDGIIEPFSSSDKSDLYVVTTQMGQRLGQFIFPKSVLCARGVLTYKGKEGKRAIRVYPPWDKTSSKQAQKTQEWQLQYFLEIHHDKPLDTHRAIKLYTQMKIKMIG